MKKTIFTVVFALITIAASAQYGRRDSNRIGITAGVNQFDLNSNDFRNKAGIGWNAGLSVRGNFYNDFDMVYAMQFSQNNFTVVTRKLLQTEDVKYTLNAVQIGLQLSY